MARGVGALNVSVNAHTAQAIKNLRDFKNEARQTCQTTKEMAQSFTGNTVKDYENRFLPKPSDVRQTAAEFNNFRSSTIDLTRETKRYNDTAIKQVSLVRQLNGAMSQLKAVGKAVAVAMVFKEGFDFGQKLRGHIEYINSWSDAYRELLALMGRGKSGLELEMEALERRNEASQKNIDKNNELIESRKAAQKQLEEDYKNDRLALRDRGEEALFGREQAAYARDQRKYGLMHAAELRRARQEAVAYEEGRKRHEEAKEEEARKKKEAEREKERKHEEAKRKAAENARRDAEAIQKLRDRVKDFGKTDLQRDQAELLRTLENLEQRNEARRHFATLERLQGGKDALEQLRENRKTLAGRSPQDTAILDARSAEGWAAIHKSINKDPQLAKFDRLIQLQEEANEIAAAKEGLEASKL